MKKMIATVFCAALALPTMSAMASTQATHNSAANDGQEMTGSAATESTTMGNSTTTMDNSTTSMETTPTGHGGNGSSAQMNDMKGMSDSSGGSTDAMGVENADETMTGRQGHSAQMESTQPMDSSDMTEHGTSPSSN